MAVGYRADAQNHLTTLSLGAVTQLTITCWLRLNADKNSYATAWDVGASNADLFGLQTRVDGTTLETYDTNGATGTNNAALTVGTWYYFAVNMNGVNGNWEYRAANSGTFTAGSWTSGSASVTATRLTIGESGFETEWGNIDIAAFKMWHGANLSTVQLHQESYLYLPQRSANLTCFYPLVGQTLTTDYSGNGRTLTGGSGASVVDGPPIVWGSAYPILFIPSSSSPTPKSLDDVGSSSESLSVGSAVSLLDSGSSTENVSVIVSTPVIDSGSGTESLAVSSVIGLTDSGTETENLTVQAGIPLADSASSTESLAVGVVLPLTDTATGTDSLSKSVTAPLTDSGSSTESLASSVSIQLNDSGSATESFAQGMPVSLSDSGSSSESFSANSATGLSQSASATDSLSVVVTTTFTDVGSSNEALLASSSGNQLLESASATDSFSVVVITALTESASSVDGIAVGASVALGDVAGSVESLTLGALKALGDQGTGSDSLSVTVALNLADTGTVVELLTTDGIRVLTEFASAVDVLHVFNHSQTIPGHMTVGDSTSPRMVSTRVVFNSVEGQEIPTAVMKSGDKSGSIMEGN